VDLILLAMPQNRIILPTNSHLMLDGGFKGAQRFYRNIILPEESKNLTPDQVHWNNEVKTIRTVVENYFSHIKKFKILTHKFRYNGNLQDVLLKHHQVFIVCAALLQRFILPNGLKI
jgi:hypothetical protein